MSKSSANKKVDPFKVRKTTSTAKPADDAITPPTKVAQAIDAFREAQNQYKHFEGEMTIQKDEILNYASDEFAKRLLKGMKNSFKILGEETMVNYVVMDSSAGLSEEDVEAFKQRWGKEAAEQLITKDLGSVRFEPAVLEANYDAIVEALQTHLSAEVLENLFKPMLMKARPGASEKAKTWAETPQELREILQSLKIKNYIR